MNLEFIDVLGCWMIVFLSKYLLDFNFFGINRRCILIFEVDFVEGVND